MLGNKNEPLSSAHSVHCDCHKAMMLNNESRFLLPDETIFYFELTSRYRYNEEEIKG